MKYLSLCFIFLLTTEELRAFLMNSRFVLVESSDFYFPQK